MALSFTAGQLVTAAELNLLVPQYAVKTVANSNSTVTLASDSEILFTLGPFQTYEIVLHAQANATVNSLGLILAWATTGTVALVSRNGRGPSTAGTTQSTSTSMHNYGFNATSGVSYGVDTAAVGSGVAGIDEWLVFTSGLSGGLVTLQFAKQSATAGSVTLQPGTYGTLRAIA